MGKRCFVIGDYVATDKCIAVSASDIVYHRF